MSETGKSYMVQYPNGEVGACSEAVIAKLEKKGGHKVLYEVNRKDGEKVVKGRGVSTGDRAAE